MIKKPKIVVLGGGTGSHMVLTGLRDFPVDLCAIISMSDSGGSNRVLRDDFGILPTSDIRQALLALADNNGDRKIFRELFAYRYHQGVGISGMTFGNLFMVALSDILGSQLKAIEETAKILHVKGKILPVTLDDVQLLARYENGHQVVGEHYIDVPKHDGSLRIVEMETIPVAKAYKGAIEAIEEADLVTVGPGDLYTSIVCNLIVQGISQALRKTKGKVVYVMNLMARYGQSFKFTAQDHIDVVEKYIGRETLDFVLVNSKADFPRDILERYEEENSSPVKDDLGNKNTFQVIKKDILSPHIYQRAKGDILHRSMIRHDSQKLAKAILALI